MPVGDKFSYSWVRRKTSSPRKGGAARMEAHRGARKGCGAPQLIAATTEDGPSKGHHSDPGGGRLGRVGFG